MLGARLTAVYLDDAFRNDAAAKSRLLTCQRNGQRILCLNTDGGDSGPSIGLHADAQEAVLGRGASAWDAENALLHAEGFSQELIGKPVKVKNHRFRAVIGILIALTLITVAAGVLWIRNHPPAEQRETTAAAAGRCPARRSVRPRDASVPGDAGDFSSRSKGDI